MTMQSNIDARNRYTAVLTDDSSVLVGNAPYGTQDRDATEKLFGWVYKQPGMATFEDCRAVFGRVWHERGSDDAMTLLQRFGIGSIAKLFMGLYDEFCQYARVTLDFGVSPQYGQPNDGSSIPDEVRDRWLLWHPESECLWEVRGKLADELADGLVSDVSGIPEFEQRWIEQQSGAAKQEGEEL